MKAWLRRLWRWPWDRYVRAVAPDPKLLPKHLEGKYLTFTIGGYIAHESSYTVTARRGGFEMGRVEWSSQWRAWMFRPHEEGVFPLSAVAEIYVFMRDRGGRQA